MVNESVAIDTAIAEAHDRFGQQQTIDHFGVQQPQTTWSSLMSKHAGTLDKVGQATVLDDSFPKRWKLLITVIDCSHTPRLLNPPKSIEALKARISAAVGIDAGRGHHGSHQEATAQAIISGLEGPERRGIDTDEDLCLFWENVRSGEGISPVSKGNSSIDCSASSKKLSSTVQSSKSKKDLSESEAREYSSLGMSAPLMSGVDELPAVEEEGSGEADEYLDFDQKERALQHELLASEESRLASEAKLEDANLQVLVLQRKTEELEEALSDAAQQSRSLAEENLQFIKAFDQQLEQRKTEIAAAFDEKYQVAIQEQGKILAETQSQVLRLEGIVEMREEQIKELEGQLREQRSAFRELASSFEEEREQFEEERKRLASKVQRVRQLEFFANCWKRKVMELTDVTGKELREHEDSLQYRIGSISTKLEEFQKGRLVQSPEFEIAELGKVQFEFFPNGDTNSRPGWCSFRMRVPDHTRLRWSAFIGKKRIGPRTDHFDQRQWWCRYGLLWLNFCPLSEVRPEILPETDTLLVGIEVHEILPAPEEPEAGTPLETIIPALSSRAPSEMQEPSRSSSISGARFKGLSSPSSLPAAAPSGNVEVLEYPSDNALVRGGDAPQLSSGAPLRGRETRIPPGGGRREVVLPPATPASTASSAALAGMSSSGLGSSLTSKALAVTSMPTPGRQLTRPQSVPSMASRKNMQRLR